MRRGTAWRSWGGGGDGSVRRSDGSVGWVGPTGVDACRLGRTARRGKRKTPRITFVVRTRDHLRHRVASLLRPPLLRPPLHGVERTNTNGRIRTPASAPTRSPSVRSSDRHNFFAAACSGLTTRTHASFGSHTAATAAPVCVFVDLLCGITPHTPTTTRRSSPTPPAPPAASSNVAAAARAFFPMSCARHRAPV